LSLIIVLFASFTYQAIYSNTVFKVPTNLKVPAIEAFLVKVLSEKSFISMKMLINEEDSKKILAILFY